jgi:hypothetical protein
MQKSNDLSVAQIVRRQTRRRRSCRGRRGPYAELAVETPDELREDRGPELVPAAEQVLDVRRVHHLVALLHQHLLQVLLEAPARLLHVDDRGMLAQCLHAEGAGLIGRRGGVPEPRDHHPCCGSRRRDVTGRRCSTGGGRRFRRRRGNPELGLQRQHRGGGGRQRSARGARGSRRCCRRLDSVVEASLERQHHRGRRHRRCPPRRVVDGGVARAVVGVGAHGHERPEHRADGAEAAGAAAASHLHLAERAAELQRRASALEERARAVAWLALHAAEGHFAQIN